MKTAKVQWIDATNLEYNDDLKRNDIIPLHQAEK